MLSASDSTMLFQMDSNEQFYWGTFLLVYDVQHYTIVWISAIINLL